MSGCQPEDALSAVLRRPRSTIENREFLCLNCGHRDDRDVNAAKNILKFGLKRLTLTLTKTKTEVLLRGAGAAVNQPELPMMRPMPLKVEAPPLRAE